MSSYQIFFYLLILIFPISDNVITSQGPGTAVEFGLAIVEKVLGSDTRSKIAKQLIF